jgi:Holliday junction resolvase RusA-like endonuclease
MAIPVLNIRIVGSPVPQGSMSAFLRGGKINVTDQKGKRLKEWRTRVTVAARDVAGPTWTPIDGPVGVHMRFGLARPVREPKRRRTWPLRRGSDIDKLVRAILDGLDNAGIYGDDSQVTAIYAVKDWHDRLGMQAPGATVHVYRIDDTHTGYAAPFAVDDPMSYWYNSPRG